MLCPRPTRPTRPEAHSPQSLRLGRVRSGPPKPALTKVFGDNWLGGLGGLGGSDMGTLRHDYPRGAGEILRSGLGGSDRYRAIKTPGVGEIL